MTTGVMTKSVKNVDVEIDTNIPKTAEDLPEKLSSEVVPAEQTDPDAATVHDSIANDNGMLLNDIALEAEVVSFIDEYRDKELTDLEKPAIILSKLRTLYNAYSVKIERSGSITKGVLTKYGIRRGMLLNIEKKLLSMEGKQWLEHYTREYGEKSLRTAQDYMALARTPKILEYGIFGKERLMEVLRAIKFLEIESNNPIATLFQQCGISFNPEESQIDEVTTNLKLEIDYAVALSKIRKAEEKKEVELGINPEYIKSLIRDRISFNSAFINDLFEIHSEGRDVNSHLESLCSDSGSGDEMLPHIKRAAALPKLVEGLKGTVESIREHSGLVNRIEQDYINDLENCVADLRNLIENLNKQLFGELCVRFRLEKSFNGYTPGVLKSGMQKYLRRARVKKGLWCLVEMDLFSLLEWEGDALEAYWRQNPEKTKAYTKRQSQKLRSNVINRMIAMMSEEVGISVWWMPLKVFELYQKWIENRDNPSSRKYLVEMYLQLTSQKMVRLISDIVSIYQLPLNYPKKSKKIHLLPIQIYNNIQEKYPNTYANQTKVDPVTWTVDKDIYPIQLQDCIDGIIYNLEIGSDHVFYWIKKLYDFAKQDGVPEFKYFKILWEVLHRFIDRNKEYALVRDQIGALQEFYKKMTHQEKPIYLYHAILLIVRRREIDWTSKPKPINISMDEIDKLYSDHLSGVKVNMDDYVMDMHTRKGKKGDKCMENFALVGAKVKNVNNKLLNKEYREIYSLIGKELDCCNNSIKQVR